MGHETTRKDTMNRTSAAADIMSRRSAFSAYNISRVRELIRGLPPRKYKLFQQIPLWLHLNRPRTPGFVSDIRVPFGIYRFHETGFWKKVLSDLKLPEKKLRPFLSSRQHIQGLYLMGSSGTLAQTHASDFDYWVVLRQEEMDPAGRALLARKLKSIETYCRQRYGQAVTFFILDERQVRENEFDVMDEESSGSAQKTLLKEEFYRTFIMIAGRIPFWAVLPPGLDDRQYRTRIDAALKGRHLRFLPEDYIDLGNLATLDRDESLGAILWQIYKSRHSPAKSLLKAALITQYFFSEEEGFLCDTIKARFCEGNSPGSLLDPYALMFEKGLSLFENLEDEAGLSLLKSCIFLRLSGEKSFLPVSGETPREALLQQYIRKWAWDDRQVRRMSRYRQWPEMEKLRFERNIFGKISSLYELVLKGRGQADAAVQMTGRDLAILTNRIAGYFRREAGKIPHCSAHARRNASDIAFIVGGRCRENGRSEWSVFGNEEQRSVGRDAFFFRGPELLKTAGWLILNGFYTGKKSRVTFQAETLCEATGGQARRFVKGVCELLGNEPPSYEQPPAWTGVAVCLQRSEGGEGALPEQADFLVRNTWGELFFDTLELAHFKSKAQACYHIAEYLWVFLKDTPSFNLPYRMFFPGGGVGMVEFEKTVKNYLGKFIKNAAGLKSPDHPATKEGRDGPDIPLLLDK